MQGHGILTVEDLNTGTILKQGDKTTLKFKLKDYDGETLSIVGKPCTVVLLTTNFKEKVTIATTTVATDGIVSFVINADLLPSRYYMEFVVDGKYIFPSEHRYQWTITPSSLGSDVNIIQMVGVEELISRIIPKVEKASADEVASIVTPRVTPKIDTDGTWIIDGKDTNLPSRGPQGPQGMQGPPGEVTKLQLDQGLMSKLNIPYITTVDSTTKVHTITHNRKTLVPILKCFMDNVEFLPWTVTVVNENSVTVDLGDQIPNGKQIRIEVV